MFIVQAKRRDLSRRSTSRLLFDDRCRRPANLDRLVRPIHTGHRADRPATGSFGSRVTFQRVRAARCAADPGFHSRAGRKTRSSRILRAEAFRHPDHRAGIVGNGSRSPHRGRRVDAKCRDRPLPRRQLPSHPSFLETPGLAWEYPAIAFDIGLWQPNAIAREQLHFKRARMLRTLFREGQVRQSAGARSGGHVAFRTAARRSAPYNPARVAAMASPQGSRPIACGSHRLKSCTPGPFGVSCCGPDPMK